MMECQTRGSGLLQSPPISTRQRQVYHVLSPTFTGIGRQNPAFVYDQTVSPKKQYSVQNRNSAILYKYSTVFMYLIGIYSEFFAEQVYGVGIPEIET